MADLKVADVIAALMQIEGVTPGAANRAPRSAMVGVIKHLEQYAGLTVDRLEAQLKEAKPLERTKKAPASLKEEVVSRYAHELKLAGTEPSQFEAVIAKLTLDKSARAMEVKAIAKEYGAANTAKSRQVGLDVIRQKFEERWKLDNRSTLKAS
jgi:hypothetical protein